MLSFRASAFAGSTRLRAPTAPVLSARPLTVSVEAKKICQVTGKRRNKANNVSFSVRRTRKFQEVNLQTKSFYWAEGERYVKLRLSVTALRTINLKGLEVVAKEQGIDLKSLPFKDAKASRKEWLAAQPPNRAPMAKNPRKIKNPERIAMSRKAPRIAVWSYGKIEYVPENELEDEAIEA